MGRVQDKVVIVTGGASGLGEASAVLLAQQGAHIVVADMDETNGHRVASTLGTAALFVAHDVRSEESWRALVQRALDWRGHLDVLVNSAGIVIPGTVEDTTLDHWHKVLAVNADGVFLGCKHAIPAMRLSGGGSIINMSSLAAQMGYPPFVFAYTASKGAVRSLTKSVAVHCQTLGDKIRCNSIHPTSIDTPMLRRHAPSDFDPTTLGFPVGQPSDVAYMVLYLASDESRFINGTEMVIDGGTMVM